MQRHNIERRTVRFANWDFICLLYLLFQMVFENLPGEVARSHNILELRFALFVKHLGRMWHKRVALQVRDAITAFLRA